MIYNVDCEKKSGVYKKHTKPITFPKNELKLMQTWVLELIILKCLPNNWAKCIIIYMINK